MPISGYSLDGKPNCCTREVWGLWVTFGNGAEGWAMHWLVSAGMDQRAEVDNTAYIFTDTRWEAEKFILGVREGTYNVRDIQARKVYLPLPIGWELPDRLKDKFPQKH